MSFITIPASQLKRHIEDSFLERALAQLQRLFTPPEGEEARPIRSSDLSLFNRVHKLLSQREAEAAQALSIEEPMAKPHLRRALKATPAPALAPAPAKAPAEAAPTDAPEALAPLAEAAHSPAPKVLPEVLPEVPTDAEATTLKPLVLRPAELSIWTSRRPHVPDVSSASVVGAEAASPLMSRSKRKRLEREKRAREKKRRRLQLA